jgi:ABC-type taurine transport system substrate-binding protein
MTMRVALMAVLIAASAPAFATQGETTAPATGAQASAQPVQAAKADDSADKKICKRVDASESRLNSKKVCLTAEQWKQREQQDSSW